MGNTSVLSQYLFGIQSFDSEFWANTHSARLQDTLASGLRYRATIRATALTDSYAMPRVPRAGTRLYGGVAPPPTGPSTNLPPARGARDPIQRLATVRCHTTVKSRFFLSRFAVTSAAICQGDSRRAFHADHFQNRAQ